jgi:hypothetical protein
MHVSTSFNEITAPLLYRSISIGDKEAKGDVLYSASMEEGQPPRKSMNKKACLTYVRELEIMAHKPDDCPQDEFAKYDSLQDVDVLRLSFAIPEKRDTIYPKRTTDHMVHSGKACRVSRHVRAGKVVISNTNSARALPLVEIPQESVHTLVTAFSFRDSPLADLKAATVRATTPFHGSTAKSKRAIYICWLPHSKAAMKLYFDPVTPRLGGGVGGPDPRGVEIAEIGLDLVTGIVDQAMRVDFPNEIIIVNIEGLGNGIRRDHQRRKSLEPIEPSKWEAALKYAIEHPPKDCSERKTAEEAGKITFKFISMQTYLEEYDWRGEFTAEEVEKWLNPKNKRRG